MVLVSNKLSKDMGILQITGCEYYTGQIEHRAAHKFAVPLATQRGRAKRLQHLWSAIIASPRHERVSAPHTIRRTRDAALDTRPLEERQ